MPFMFMQTVGDGTREIKLARNQFRRLDGFRLVTGDDRNRFQGRESVSQRGTALPAVVG